jgi:hypothetical protein
VLKSPKQVENPDLRDLKIDIKNDNINLRRNIITAMININQITPNYFRFNEPKAILNGNVKLNIKKTTYTKKVKIYNVKPPFCTYNFYGCKLVGSQIFCNTAKPVLKFTLKQYNNIQKELYKNKNYTLYHNNIYKIKKVCKQTIKTIKCEKETIKIDIPINIKNSQNQTIFRNNYIQYHIDDPCKDISYYANKKVYTITSDKKNIINNLSQRLAIEIINDIAPHIEYINADIYDELDIDASNKDEKLFEQTLPDNYNLSNLAKINILNNLSLKYPKSCVIPYNLAINLLYIKQYNQAKQYLKHIINSKCDNDIKDSANNLLSNLHNLY